MAAYVGMNGKKQYTLGAQLAAGGEGIVYELTGDSQHVAKLYKPNRFATEADRSKMERKLRTMIAMKIPAVVDGRIRLAWPQDILYEKGKLVGFVMPHIDTPYKIFHIYRVGPGSVREQEYQNYTWKYSVQFAYNLAWVVHYVHKHSIVIGDLNQSNIAVDLKTGAVILIDCDSFDIRDPVTGEHFPCVVGLQELLAPELQTVGSLRNGTFTKESDNFSLAIHIFRLLVNNEDPFGGVITGNASQSNLPGNQAIINGECLYVRNVPGKKLLPRMPKLEILPVSLRQLFRQTFDYTATTALSRRKNRATAAQWVAALGPLSTPEPNPHYKHCSNPKHVYPAHNVSCPWCEIERAMQPKPSPYQPRTAPRPAKSRPASKTQKPCRSANLLYGVLILCGVVGGLAYGELASGMVNSVLGIEMTPGVATGLLAIIGFLSGLKLAFSLEGKYTHAKKGGLWLLIGLPVLMIPYAVTLAFCVLVTCLSSVSAFLLTCLSSFVGVA